MATKDKFSRVKEVLSANYSAIKGVPGVKEVGHGFKYKDGKRTAIPSIIVSVGRKTAKHDLEEANILPNEIEGVPLDVIEMHSYKQAADSYKICNPLCGGLSISESRFASSGGTMGAIVFENGTNFPMGLTNHHVLFQNTFLRKSKIGDPIIQPAFSSVTAQTIIGKLARGNAQYDCAVFYLNNSRQMEGSNVLNGFAGKIQGTKHAEPDIKVKKSGARTNMTYGIVDHIFPTYFTVMPNPLKPALNNEISDNGDSGAIWVTDDAQNYAVGLHNLGEAGRDPNVEWAGAIHIELVMQIMNINF